MKKDLKSVPLISKWMKKKMKEKYHPINYLLSGIGNADSRYFFMMVLLSELTDEIARGGE